VVLFESRQTEDEEYEPIVPIREGVAEALATAPHGLMREMVPALKALWYVLHLPRSFADVVEMWAANLAKGYLYDIPQRYLIAPFPLIAGATYRDVLHGATLILCPRANLVEVEVLRRSLGIPLSTTAFEDLGPETLTKHWIDVARVIGKTDPRL